MTPGTLVLTAGDVRALLPVGECIEPVERALRLHDAGLSLAPASLGLTPAQGSFHVKAAGLVLDGRTCIAVKANMNLPGNPDRHGLPTIQGVLVLLDGDDGRPLAVMDSAVITAVRTAAVAAVAARHLARPDAGTVAIVGCGAQGAAQLRAMAAVRDVRRALVVDVDGARARGFADAMARELEFPVEVARDLRGAVAASDICVTCTTSTSAVLGPGELHAGLFVAAVGADNPQKQEIDPRAMAAARVVVDSLDACAASGDLRHALAAGVMTREDVHGELSAVVAGRVAGRSSPDQVFVFDSTGTALQDVAAAVSVYRAALEAGRGIGVMLAAS